MQNLYSVGTEDPDYLPTEGESSRETVNQSLLEQDAKEESVHKIQSIIHKQFSLEVHLKEREIELIDQRISQTRSMLDRLRACVLARYYGTSTKPGRERSEPGRRAGKRRFLETKVHKRTSTDASGNDTSQGSDASSNKIRGVSKSSSTISRPVLSPTEASQTSRKQLNPSNDADGFLTSVNEDSKGHAPGESSIHADLNRFDLRTDLQRSKFAKSSQVGEPGERSNASRSGELNTNHSEEIKFEKGNTTPVGQSQAGNQQGTPGHLPVGESVTKFPETDACLSHAGSRFYLKKRVIVGNTSKYIPLEGREANDKSTHKWMVYVRGAPKDPQIDLFIKKVWFFLHPSYRPNDIVEVNKPPFHLTRRGWGEFPIRVQLHFVDARNKRVDIIHELKLDRTYTGLQTLGAETVVDLELDRKTFEDLGIPVVCPTPSPDPSPLVDRGDSAFVKEEDDTDHSTQVRKKEIGYSIQIPQLKKLKVEEATYSESSPFSSIGSTPVHSQASSRCTSPETVECCIRKFCDSTEQALHEGVKVHTLIDPKRDLAKFPYCAESVKQYCRWNTGKRRAAEWQRALALRRHVQAKTDARDLSTKDVMLWCRRYGYTPCDKAGLGEKSCFCKMCGLPVAWDNESEDDSSLKEDAIHSGCAGTSESFSSLSSSAKFLLSLEEKEISLPDAAQSNDDEEEVEVDVVGELPKRPAERKLQSPVYSLPLRPEEEWVREVCGDIGVKLQSVNFEGVESHAVERMLWSACSQFIEDILRQAWASAADQSSSCRSRLVVPRHVYRAIDSLPTCDFLLNSYLGSLEREAEP